MLKCKRAIHFEGPPRRVYELNSTEAGPSVEASERTSENRVDSTQEERGVLEKSHEVKRAGVKADSEGKRGELAADAIVGEELKTSTASPSNEDSKIENKGTIEAVNAALEKTGDKIAEFVQIAAEKVEAFLIAITGGKLEDWGIKKGFLTETLQVQEEDFSKTFLKKDGEKKAENGPANQLNNRAQEGVVDGALDGAALQGVKALKGYKFDVSGKSGREADLRKNWNENGDKNNWASIVDEVGELPANSGISKGLVLAIAAQESGLNPNVPTQASGDTGPFQFIKRFAWTDLVRAHPDKYSLDNFEEQAKDPRKSTEACFDYIKIICKQINADPKNPNDFARIYAAYNKGYGALLAEEKRNKDYANKEHLSARYVADLAREIDGLSKKEVTAPTPTVAPLESQDRLIFNGFPFAFPKGTNIVRTSPYGYRNDPKTGERKMHHGQDIAMPEGTRFYASQAMRVVNKGNAGGKGNFIELQLEDGSRVSVFHMQYLPQVSGDLRVGDFVGYVGSTGHSTGPHMHFEFNKPSGEEIDPTPFTSKIPDRSGNVA